MNWPRIWLYGIGEIPITATMVLFGLFLLFFYNSVLGMSAPLVGVGFTAGLVLDAALDPFIGYRSDHSRHPLGRRRSFMLAGASTMGLCFALIFLPPRSLGTAGLFLWLAVCSMLFRFTMAVYRIPYLSLGAELSQDYAKRTVVMAVRSVCGLVGALTAAALSFLLFFRSSPGGVDPQLQYANYGRMGLAFGLILSATGLIAFFGTSGHRDPAVLNAAPRVTGFFQGFRMTAENRAFRSVWLSYTLFYSAVVLNASLAVHFLTWCAGIHDASILSGVQVAFGVGACGGVMLWMALAGRREKRTCYGAGMLGTALILGAATLLIGPGKLLGVGRAWPLLAGYAVAGVFASALWVLPASMLADIADQDESITGARREGAFFGMLNLGEKVASGMAVLLAGFLLRYFVQLVPASQAQTPVTIDRLAILYGAVPAVLLLVSTAMIRPYALTRAATGDIQRRLGRNTAGVGGIRTPGRP